MTQYNITGLPIRLPSVKNLVKWYGSFLDEVTTGPFYGTSSLALELFQAVQKNGTALLVWGSSMPSLLQLPRQEKEFSPYEALNATQIDVMKEVFGIMAEYLSAITDGKISMVYQPGNIAPGTLGTNVLSFPGPQDALGRNHFTQVPNVIAVDARTFLERTGLLTSAHEWQHTFILEHINEMKAFKAMPLFLQRLFCIRPGVFAQLNDGPTACPIHFSGYLGEAIYELIKYIDQGNVPDTYFPKAPPHFLKAVIQYHLSKTDAERQAVIDNSAQELHKDLNNYFNFLNQANSTLGQSGSSPTQYPANITTPNPSKHSSNTGLSLDTLGVPKHEAFYLQAGRQFGRSWLHSFSGAIWQGYVETRSISPQRKACLLNTVGPIASTLTDIALLSRFTNPMVCLIHLAIALAPHLVRAAVHNSPANTAVQTITPYLAKLQAYFSYLGLFLTIVSFTQGNWKAGLANLGTGLAGHWAGQKMGQGVGNRLMPPQAPSNNTETQTTNRAVTSGTPAPGLPV